MDRRPRQMVWRGLEHRRRCGGLRDGDGAPSPCCELYTRGAASRTKKYKEGAGTVGKRRGPALATATAPRPDRDRDRGRRRWIPLSMPLTMSRHPVDRFVKVARRAPCRGNEEPAGRPGNEMNVPRRSACAVVLRPAPDALARTTTVALHQKRRLRHVTPIKAEEEE